MLFLLIFLVFSVCTVGYVIFFRTVSAQVSLPEISRAIVFEEPELSVDLEPLKEGKTLQVPDLSKVSLIVDKWFAVS